MKFIKRRNLLEGEELLFVPKMHWMYFIKYTVLILLLIPVFFIGRAVVLYNELGFIEGFFDEYIKFAIIVVVIIAALILVCRITMFMSFEYGITNKRLIIKKGVFKLVVAEIPTDRIESIYCFQGITGRIFRYGTIRFSGIGGMAPIFYMICNPYGVRRRIVSIIEKNKAITVIHGDLPKPPPPEPVIEEEPLGRYGTFVRVIQGKK